MNQERLYQIILSPHVSEKTTIIAEKKNEHVFRVHATATKPEIKDAIEFLFQAKVKAVRIVNVKSKKRIFRNIEGCKKAWKKAYVTLQSDQKLDLIGTQ